MLPHLAAARRVGWGGVPYSAQFSSLLGHGLFYLLLLLRHPVAQVTPYLRLTPCWRLALAVLVWGDRWSPELWLSDAVMLSGVLVIAVRRRQKQRITRAAWLRVLNPAIQNRCMLAR